jgi:hypothetical protein
MRFARRLRIGLPRDGPFRAGIVFKQEIYPRTQMKSDCPVVAECVIWVGCAADLPRGQ